MTQLAEDKWAFRLAPLLEESSSRRSLIQRSSENGGQRCNHKSYRNDKGDEGTNIHSFWFVASEARRYAMRCCGRLILTTIDLL
jgi:hypothetical protein